MFLPPPPPLWIPTSSTTQLCVLVPVLVGELLRSLSVVLDRSAQGPKQLYTSALRRDWGPGLHKPKSGPCTRVVLCTVENRQRPSRPPSLPELGDWLLADRVPSRPTYTYIHRQSKKLRKNALRKVAFSAADGRDAGAADAVGTRTRREKKKRQMAMLDEYAAMLEPEVDEDDPDVKAAAASSQARGGRPNIVHALPKVPSPDPFPAPSEDMALLLNDLGRQAESLAVGAGARVLHETMRGIVAYLLLRCVHYAHCCCGGGGGK